MARRCGPRTWDDRIPAGHVAAIDEPPRARGQAGRYGLAAGLAGLDPRIPEQQSIRPDGIDDAAAAVGSRSRLARGAAAVEAGGEGAAGPARVGAAVDRVACGQMRDHGEVAEAAHADRPRS